MLQKFLLASSFLSVFSLGLSADAVHVDKYKLSSSDRVISWKKKTTEVFLREPTSQSQTSQFKTTSSDDHYEQRLRAWLEIPASGNYQFALAADDTAVLYLGKTELPGDKEKIAYTNWHTGTTNWTKYASQKSELVSLEAGDRVYLEGWMREYGGGDYINVAWNYDDSTSSLDSTNSLYEIDAAHFSSIDSTRPELQINQSVATIFQVGAEFELALDVKDTLNQISSFDIYLGETLVENVQNGNPISIQLTDQGSFRLRVVAKNDVDAELNSTFLDLTVIGDQVESPQGIVVKVWDGISGWKVSDLTPFLNTTPNRVLTFDNFDKYLNIGDDYGAQVITELLVPEDGLYHFYVSSDDQSELFLWLDGVRTKVASAPRSTGRKNYVKYESQKSKGIQLLKDQKVKVEILHKEGRWSDHLNLAWNFDTETNFFVDDPVEISTDSLQTVDPTLPSVAIVTPHDQKVVKLGETVDFEINAHLTSGELSSIQLFEGETLIAEGNVSTLNFTWTSTSTGWTTFHAKVNDQLGRESTSTKVRVLVQDVLSASETGLIVEKFIAESGQNLNDFRDLLVSNSIAVDRTLLTETVEHKSNETHYFTKTSGWLVPPKTGFYKFSLYGDDQVEVWVGKESRHELDLLFWLDHWTHVNRLDFRPSQAAQTLFLEANQRVYVKILHHQKAGGSSFGLVWNYDEDTQDWISDEFNAIPVSFFETDSLAEENLSLSGLSEGDIVDLNSESQLSVTNNNALIQSVNWTLNGQSVTIDPAVNSLSLTHDSVGYHELKADVVFANGFESTLVTTFNVVDPDSTSTTLAGQGILVERWPSVDYRVIDWNLPSSWVKKHNPSVVKVSNTLDQAYLDGLSPTRMRAILTAPETGLYKFWVAGDDRIRFYLSSDDSVANKKLEASLASSTIHKDFDRFPRQKSIEVSLVAGQAYYLEVFQWNLSGKQHLSVQWNYDSNYDSFVDAPQPIKVDYLAPWNNNLPEARFVELSENRFIGDEVNPQVKVELLSNTTSVQAYKIRVNSTDYSLSNADTKQEITLNLDSNVDTFNLNIVAVMHNGTELVLDQTTWYRENDLESFDSLVGVTRESWVDVPGDKVVHLHHFSDFPFYADASQLHDENLDRFEDKDRNLGERWRGYFVPPVSGSYNFWMIARDQAEFWLSTDSSVKNASKVLLTTKSSGPDRWRKVDQKSGAIEFTGDEKYYFEIYFKKGKKSNAYFSLGWERPDEVNEFPILNENMRPFIDNDQLPAISIEYPSAGAEFKYSEPIVFHPKHLGAIPDGSTYTLFAGDSEIWTGDSNHSGLVALSAPSVGELSLRLILEHPELGEAAAPYINIVVNSEDQDDDGLKDHKETQTWNSDPSIQDTDFDGLQDGKEVLWYGSSPTVADVTTQLIQELDVHQPAQQNVWVSGDRGIYNPQSRGRIEYTFELQSAEKAILDIKTYEFGEQVKQSGEIIVLVNGDYVNRKPLYLFKDESLVYQVVLPYLPAGEHELSIIWNNHDLGNGSELCIEAISLHEITGADEDGNGIKDWIEEKVQSTSDVLVNEHLYLSPYPLEISSEFPAYTKVFYGSDELETQLASKNSIWVKVPIKDPKELRVEYENGAYSETLNLAWESIDPTQFEGLSLNKHQSLKFELPESVVDASMLINGKYYQLTQGSDFVHTFSSWDTSFEVNYQLGENEESIEHSFEVEINHEPYSYDFSLALGRDYSFWWRNLPEDAVFEYEGLDFIKSWENTLCTVLISDPGPSRAVVMRRGENGPILASTAVTGYDIQVSSVNSGLINVVEEYENGTVLTEEVYTLDMFPPDFRIEIHVFASGVVLDDGTIDRTITAEDFDETGTYRLRLLKTNALRTTLCHRIKIYQGDRLIYSN